MATVYVSVRNAYDVPVRGDEPHYLIVTNSLLQDGDFDVRNDYLLQRYFPYHPLLIDPHVNFEVFTPSSLHWYPLHGVGLPVYLVPFVKTWGVQAGSKAAMVLVAVVLVLLAYVWARRFTSSEWAAWVGALTLGLSPVYLGLEGRVFPDLVTAALLLGCLLVVDKRARPGWQVFAVGVMAGASVWIHFKTVPMFGTAVAFVALSEARARGWGRPGLARAALAAAPAALSLIVLLVVSHRWYGAWSPTRAIPSNNRLLAMWPTTGLAAWSFDGTKGLFTSSPALLLMVFGLPIWARRHGGSALRVLTIVGPMFVLHATFWNWSGGYAPSARYVLQFLPVLVPAAAVALEAPGRRARQIIVATVIAFQSSLAVAFVLRSAEWTIAGMPNPLYEGPRSLGLRLDRFMPHFDDPGRVTGGTGWLIAWMILALATLFAGALAARSSSLRRTPDTEPVGR